MKSKKKISPVLIILLAVLIAVEAIVIITGINVNKSDENPIVEAQYLNSSEQVVNSQSKLGGNSGIEWNYRKAYQFTDLMCEDGLLDKLSYPLDNAQVACCVYGTVNDNSDKDIGFVTEVSIPWSSLGGIPQDRKIGFSAVLYNTDGDGLIRDAMTGDRPKDWYTVILS